MHVNSSNRLAKKITLKLKRAYKGGDGTSPTPVAATSSPTAISSATGSFTNPDEIKTWIENPDNFKKYILGLGVILKYKQGEMTANNKSITLALTKLSEQYKDNEKNYEQTLASGPQDELTDMRESMQEKVRESINIPFEKKYAELLQKKQAYETVLKSITNRRWYIVNDLQVNNGNAIKEKIKLAVDKVYSFYRGKKYEKIRKDLYSHLKTIAERPQTYQNSFMLNTSITGPAGSGKTTLAREIGKWYSKIGILTYDAFFEDEKDKLSLIETGRSGLIAEYTGQTAPKTLGVLVSSLERTLFIDEAYSVAGCAFESDGKVAADQYGEEFLAELLRFMNDHKGFSSLIVAGYENLMKLCFFARNEGLPRRFPQQISLPFYSSDELFGIFCVNVVRKNIADEDRAIDFEKKKKGEKKLSEDDQLMISRDAKIAKTFSNICVLKPSIMMIHNDVSYNGFETLRKYLLILKERYPNDDEFQGVYSWTIINHVLTNFLDFGDDSVRKHLLRRKFYEEVFNFSSPNLSFFPAQAGEMENLADECSQKIMANVHTKITADQELSLFDDYCKNKNLKLTIIEESGDPKISEPFEISSEQLQIKALEDTIKELYSQELELEHKFGKMPNSVSGNAGDPPVRSLLGETKDKIKSARRSLKRKKEKKPISPSSSGESSVRSSPSESPPESALESVVAPTPALPTVFFGAREKSKVISYELCLLSVDYDMMRRKIHNFLQLDTLFSPRNGITTNVPSLNQLWNNIINPPERKLIIKHIVRLYTEKLSQEYIQDILDLDEKKYPIHINRQKLETELLNFKNKTEVDLASNAGANVAGQPTGTNEEELLKSKNWNRFINKIEDDLMAEAMKHKYVEQQFSKLNVADSHSLQDVNDALYEDFGISEP